MAANKRERKSPSVNCDNCVTVQNESYRPNALKAVEERRKLEKGKVFERIPIFPRGFIMREVKQS